MPVVCFFIKAANFFDKLFADFVLGISDGYACPFLRQSNGGIPANAVAAASHN